MNNEFSDDNLAKTSEKLHSQWEKHANDWQEEARDSYDLVAGHQWSEQDKRAMEDAMRPVVTFNRVGTFVDSVSGLEISNRQEVSYIPRELGDVGVNELLTSAANWSRDLCDAEDEETEAFIDLLISGMGWCLSDDAMVRLPNTHFATTRKYTGSVIEISLENGKKLTGTPNHPVLTDSGWKRLHMLQEGDNLINSRFLEGIEGFPVQQFDHVETRLKDKIDAFRAGRKACRFATSPR